MISKFLEEYDDYPVDLTLNEVAEILHCSRSNLSKQLKNKSLPFDYFRIGKRVFIPKYEIREYLLICKNDK